MNKEALLELRRVVENAPDNRLHMLTFVEETKCGTAYCAAGWATQDQWFHERGLVLEEGEIFFAPEQEAQFRKQSVECSSFSRLEWFFDLNQGTTDRLFAGTMDFSLKRAITKKMVITNIDAILEGGCGVSYEKMVVLFGKIADRLKGINLYDLTTAEKQIVNMLDKNEAGDQSHSKDKIARFASEAR